MHKSILHYLLCISVVVLFCVVGFFIRSLPTIHNQEVSGNFIAQGIKISSFRDDRLLINLQLGKIQLTGKKSGFLRLGFWKVMRFDAVIMDMYPPVSGMLLARENILPSLMPGRKESRVNEYAGLAHSADQITDILRLSSRSVKGFEMHDILWRIHENNMVIFELNSRFADFDFKHKSMIFKGSVKVEAGLDERILETSTLEWNLERGILKIPCAYRLTVDGQRRYGSHLKTDLHLKKLEDV
ncbi:MAG: hypothetical protein J7L96_06895 [Bacteroidales bacterium]|nr:hypothetical protein [Bacteroidales bacterium]